MPVTLPDGLEADQSQPCDLRGQAVGETIKVINRSFGVKLKGNQPASFIIDMKKQN